MRRIAALLLTSLLMAPGCANSTAAQSAEPIMRLTLQMRGSLDISSGSNIRYYVVLNTATLADQPGVSPQAAEASASAGVTPTSGQPAGPRVYGPFPLVRPKIGWDLPFFLSGPNDTTSTDPRRTREYTGTAPLLPVTWTDYFVLSNENGQLRLIHGQHPSPVSNPELILPNVDNLQQGQDWFVDRSSLVLLIRLRTLVNGANLVPATPDGTPGGTFVSANFVTSNTEGQIIDRWTLSENEPGVTLRTTLRSQDQNQKFRPSVLFPLNKPSGVSDDAVNLASYNSEIRQ
ncbi:MAG TPA: hypothetical protein V6D05_06050 [Stenomitos sp.]